MPTAPFPLPKGNFTGNLLKDKQVLSDEARIRQEAEFKDTGSFLKGVSQQGQPQSETGLFNTDFEKAGSNLAGAFDRFIGKEEGVPPEVIKPDLPSKEDPVKEGSDVIGSPEETSSNLFAGLDLSQITNEIGRNTDLGQKLAEEISRRRKAEGVLGKDSILGGLGISTIKEEGESEASLISNEASIEEARKILSGDKELSKLGLQPNASDDQILRFYRSQGFSEEAIKGIFNARDAQLKQERFSADNKTLVERKEQEIQEKVAQQVTDIRQQVEKSQQLLQRQRSLRGVGRSSITESDIVQLQTIGDKTINDAKRVANLELQRFKLQQEGAEAEVLNNIDEALREANKSLNDQIVQQNQIENDLVASGQLDRDAAFESLIGNLEIAGVEGIGEVDKFTSEAVGWLKDKFGNDILDQEGNKIPVGGKNAVDVDTISNFADALTSGTITSGFVPSELRESVINELASRRDKTIQLTGTQLADSQLLAKELFGNNKESSVAAIQGFMQDGLSKKEILERGKNIGFSKEYNGAIRNGIKNVTLKGFNKEDRTNVQNFMSELLENGQSKEAIDVLLSSAREGGTAQQQDKLIGLGELTENLTRIRKSIKDFESQGGDLSRVAWTLEAGHRLIGKTSDPVLTRIATEIGIAIQAYRQSRSGAAFSESEAKEYRELFPGIGKDFELNEALIGGVLNTAETATNNYYRQKVGVTNFNNIFSNGVMNILHPGQGFNGEADVFDISGLSDDLTDEEILGQSFGQTGDNIPAPQTDFNIKDDSSLDSFLDDTAFNKGDQTSQSKGVLANNRTKISDIGLGKITQSFGATSPLKIDNVKLADGSTGTPGIDIDGKIGDKIPSTVSGTVKVIKSRTGLGNRVIITDENGNQHFFNHMDGFNVKNGQQIKKGDNIGTIGNSGNVIKGKGGDGSHLDYRVKSSKGWIDPNKFLIS